MESSRNHPEARTPYRRCILLVLCVFRTSTLNRPNRKLDHPTRVISWFQCDYVYHMRRCRSIVGPKYNCEYNFFIHQRRLTVITRIIKVNKMGGDNAWNRIYITADILLIEKSVCTTYFERTTNAWTILGFPEHGQDNARLHARATFTGWFGGGR